MADTEISDLVDGGAAQATDLFIIVRTQDVAGGNRKLTVANLEAALDHDSLAGFLAAEHIDWSVTGAEDVHVDRVASGAVTQHVALIDHDSLLNFVAAEHVDWASTGAEDIHEDRFANLRRDKAIIIENPSGAEDISFWFTNKAITISEMRAVVRGSTPSVTWTIRHGPDRSAAGNEVVTGGTTTTSQSTGSDVTVFNDATIPADSFIWVETTAQSGTVDEIYITAVYSED